MSSQSLFLLRSVIEALGYCLLQRLAVRRHPVLAQVPTLAFGFLGLLRGGSLLLPVPLGNGRVELFVEVVLGGGVHGAAVVPDVFEDHAGTGVSLPSHTEAGLLVLRHVPEERGEDERDLLLGRAHVDAPCCKVWFRDEKIMAGFLGGEV